MSCSESVLELSIMPKDEDVLQLVSVSVIKHFILGLPNTSLCFYYI